MKPMLKPCLVPLALFLSMPAAWAQSSPLTANVTFASQYISRGFQQTWGKPALQGGVDYADPSGFFAGTWMSNVSGKFVEGASMEWDLYGGYSGSANDVAYTVALYYYVYPGGNISATNVKYDYGELSLGATYKMFTAKYNYTYTKDFFGFTDARGTGYLDLAANVDLGAGNTLNLHFGRGAIKHWGDYNWKDYKIALAHALDGGWTVTGALTRAQGDSDVYENWAATTPNSAGVIETSKPGKTVFVLSVTRTF